MADPCGQRLSLAEWQVLCLVREEPTYGLVLVGLLARDGSLGQVWSVPKAVVYRALQRLEQLGLIRTVGEQRTSQGPVRSLYEATPAGQRGGRGVAQHAGGARPGRQVRADGQARAARPERG